MSRQRKSKSSSKSGYGLPNVNKQRLSKKDVNLILNKAWADVTSMDIYKLYQYGLKTDDLAIKFNRSSISILNRLRFQ